MIIYCFETITKTMIILLFPHKSQWNNIEIIAVLFSRVHKLIYIRGLFIGEGMEVPRFDCPLIRIPVV